MSHACPGCDTAYWSLTDAAACWYGHMRPDVYIGKSPAPLTGGSADYYKVRVEQPTSGGAPYMAECNDIIEALRMEYDVANAFKAAWRVAALRQGRGKPGQSDAVYDGEKIVFFGQRIIERAK